MNFFPITSVNNFFNDPDELVKYSKKLNYKTNVNKTDGSWPGVRSDNLYNIDKELFNRTILSILSLYYEDMRGLEFSNTYIFFHKSKAFSKSKDDIRNKGWIHRDAGALGGIIYLNKNSFPESGTSLYTLKKEPVRNRTCIKIKEDLYLRGKYNEKIYTQKYNYLRKQFVKTHTFKNVYNTLVAFDGSQWHAADNLWTKPGEDRLTMVFFINKLKVKTTPRTRLDMMEQAVI